MTTTFTATFDQLRRGQKAANWERSAAARKLICDVADSVIALCVAGAPKSEIELALDTLSTLTGKPRSYEC